MSRLCTADAMMFTSQTVINSFSLCFENIFSSMSINIFVIKVSIFISYEGPIGKHADIDSTIIDIGLEAIPENG